MISRESTLNHGIHFSTADDVVPSSDIDAVAAAKEKLGCSVSRVCFEDSEHVAHMDAHKEAYASSVASFVTKCLREGGPTTDASEGKEKEDEGDTES